MQDDGVPPSGSGHQPSASAAGASSQSGVPNAVHTPLPWALSYGYDLPRLDRVAAYVAPDSVNCVGIKLATPWVEGAWDDDEEAAANAEFIVRACNSHYRLRWALEAMVAWANGAGGGYPGREAAAALALASGIEGEAGDPQGLHPKGESPVPKADAQGQSS